MLLLIMYDHAYTFSESLLGGKVRWRNKHECICCYNSKSFPGMVEMWPTGPNWIIPGQRICGLRYGAQRDQRQWFCNTGRRVTSVVTGIVADQRSFIYLVCWSQLVVGFCGTPSHNDIGSAEICATRATPDNNTNTLPRQWNRGCPGRMLH